ncbi:MAG: hypothetical protein GY751_04125 [Bacteroidetes bacterium]|nr:hypothetical protein [Bacteroidota bacterium]
MNPTLKFKLILLLILPVFMLHANEPGIDRPMYSFSANVLKLKTFSIETGSAALIADKNTYLFDYQSIKVRFATLKTMEMFVQVRVPGLYQRTDGGNKHRIGLASPATGAKIIMKRKEGEEKMGMAFLGSVTANFGTKEFKNTKLLPQFRIAMDIDWNEKTNMRVNYGVIWLENKSIIDPEDNPVVDPYVTVSTSVCHQVKPKLDIFGEFYALVKFNNFRQDYVLNGGFVIHVKENVQLDISGGAGLSPNSPRGVVNIGFGGIWPKKNLEQ